MKTDYSNAQKNKEESMIIKTTKDYEKYKFDYLKMKIKVSKGKNKRNKKIKSIKLSHAWDNEQTEIYFKEVYLIWIIG